MCTKFSTQGRFFIVLGLTLWLGGSYGWSQNRPRLSLETGAGQLQVRVAGEPGDFYAIQITSELSSSSSWRDRTLLQANGGGTIWMDPEALSSSQQFYRAVLVNPPADTNLIFISAGSFTMGSPVAEALRFDDEVQHVVTISRGFWMQRHLVTQGVYLGVVGSNPSYFAPTNGFSQDLNRPVDQVSWADATNYCALLTARELAAGRIPGNCAYRLPTESEWEYACRAGTSTAFYLGNGLSSAEANFWGRYEYDSVTGQVINANGVYLQTTTPVGSYAPNGWGLYDMIGNVWEWCQDWYGPYPAGSVVDPQGPASGNSRTVRGGDWGAFGRFCRAAQRSGNIPAPSSRRVGFRVVLALSPS